MDVSHAFANELPQAPTSQVEPAGVAPTEAPSLDEDWPTLSVLARRYITIALGRTKGNKTKAAEMLGIDRRTLNRIMARDRAKRSKPAEPKAIAAE